MWISKNLPLLLAAPTLFLPAIAQNSTKNSTNTTTAEPVCSTPLSLTKINPDVNSTGQYKFNWNSSYAGNDPWYFSVRISASDIDNDTLPGNIVAHSYISVPKNVPKSTHICTYTFHNINATLEAGGENSCSGAISAPCVEYLTKELSEVSAYECPSQESESDEFKKACPMLVGSAAQSTSPVPILQEASNYYDVLLVPNKG